MRRDQDSLEPMGSGAEAAGGCFKAPGGWISIPPPDDVNGFAPGESFGDFPAQSGTSRLGSDAALETGHHGAERLGREPISSPAGSSRPSEDQIKSDLVGKKQLCEVGHLLLQRFLEVLPLRSLSMEGESISGIFPLPTSRFLSEKQFDQLSSGELSWLSALCMGLNSFWGGPFFCDKDPTSLQKSLLEGLVADVRRTRDVQGEFDGFNWKEFFRTRSVDYHGEEVKIAKRFRWKNISPALPREIGSVPLSEVCEKGAKFYVDHIDSFLKPRCQWGSTAAPRVTVDDCDWAEVCVGLVTSGVCVVLPENEVFSTGDELLLNGLFGVSKDEVNDGVETYRLIMNLIPFNNISQPLSGDIATLPNWGMMSPYFIQPSEQLLISSEDVRCFFYVMSVPPCWYKYLAFNKLVPDSALPPELQGQDCYLAAKVLPMGFLNSVSLAQHVHRNMARASGLQQPGVALPERELRKDKSFPVSQDNWRIYLDNFDLLERVEATKVASLEGSVAPSILALRNHYEVWDVPRNAKKGVARSSKAEVQGAIVDGVQGVAYPRDQKLIKYICAALQLCESLRVSQRQMQVVCGGLVYVSMFRRALLGSLNAVWAFIESFEGRECSTSCCLLNARLKSLGFSRWSHWRAWISVWQWMVRLQRRMHPPQVEAYVPVLHCQSMVRL